MRKLTKYRINLNGYTGFFYFLIFVTVGLTVLSFQRNNSPIIQLDMTLQQFAKHVGTIKTLEEFWPFLETKFMAQVLS